MLAWISITLYIVCLQNAVNHCFWKVFLMVKIQCKLFLPLQVWTLCFSKHYPSLHYTNVAFGLADVWFPSGLMAALMMNLHACKVKCLNPLHHRFIAWNTYKYNKKGAKGANRNITRFMWVGAWHSAVSPVCRSVTALFNSFQITCQVINPS